jgi:hypothetical protein
MLLLPPLLLRLLVPLQVFSYFFKFSEALNSLRGGGV